MKLLTLALFCIVIASTTFGQSKRTWTPKHLVVLHSFGSDTSDIRGIQFSINEASIINIEDVYKEFFNGQYKRDFYHFALKSSEIPPAFFQRPLDIYEIIDVYIKHNKL
jgi:hypothetical protein